MDSEYDMLKVSQSGNSKRSVKEAYQRAKKYLARKSKSSSKLSSIVSDNGDSDSEDKESTSDSSNSDS